jgi:hypothetical protein
MMGEVGATANSRLPQNTMASSTPNSGQRSAAVLTLVMTGWSLITAVQAQDPAYPTQQELRRLQLLTFDCARDNLPVPCEQARKTADPLLDHPRLPGSCKDSLWQIRQQAKVAPSNSFQRREQLDQIAVDMMNFCKANPRPVQPNRIKE